MPNVYRWKDHNYDITIIGIDDDNDMNMATCYTVRADGRVRKRRVLGQYHKFLAIDEETFEGPFEMTWEEITETYGPIVPRSKRVYSDDYDNPYPRL